MANSCLNDKDVSAIKVYTKLISSVDVAYVTVKLKDSSNVVDLKEMVIKKLKLSKSDPKLYDIVMVVESAKSDFVKSIPLWSDDKPLIRLKKYAELGQTTATNFYLTMADGVKAKIYTGDVLTGQTYTTIVITRETTCSEALKMLLKPSRDVLKLEKMDNLFLVQLDHYEQTEKILPDVGILLEYMTPFCTVHLKIFEDVMSSVEVGTKVQISKRPLAFTGSSGASTSTSDFFEELIEMF